MKFPTKAIHSGQEPNLLEGGSGDVVVPIHMTSTFARKEVDKPTRGYEYSRSGNPTRHALEKCLASLESAKFALAYSSGLGASINLAFLLNSGDHVILFDDVYGGTYRLFSKCLNNFQIETTYVDATNPKNVEKAIKKNTKMIWLESPTNPLLKLCDIHAISEVAKKNNITTVVDNTFASPYIQNPLILGADIVLHSTTKYISGHSDVVGGCIMLNDKTLLEKLKFYQNALGAVPSPFDSWLVLRGVKTLAIRMERHSENAQKIAEFLSKHPKVKKVNYPGLSTHPQHNLAKKQMRRFGGMLSFELNADLLTSKRFLEKLTLFFLAESLGGVESLIEHPASMTHASIPKEKREKTGITDSLTRVSVGIEDIDDLINDLESALKMI